jgi:hypothetical protein
MGTDEVASALGTDPLAGSRVVLEAIEVGLGCLTSSTSANGTRVERPSGERSEL